MDLTWTKEPPKVAGLYWQRTSELKGGKAQPLIVTEEHLGPDLRPASWDRTPQERKANHLQTLRDLKTEESVVKIIEDFSVRFWEIWWCGPLPCPPFPA